MLYRRLLFDRNIGSAPFLFKLICLIGLSWQLFEISSEYVKYKVDIQTTVLIPEEVEDMSMVICLPIEYLINYNKFNAELQYNWTRREFERKDMLRNLSIHQVYYYTYDANDILYTIHIWNTGSKSKNFSLYLKMQKYFFKSEICYLYSLKSFKPVSVQLIGAGLVAYLQFNKHISETHAVYLFIVEKDKISFRETIAAQYIYRGSPIKLDHFQSSYYSIKYQLLPPPYETACYSYSQLNFTNRIECIEKCIVLKFYKKWGAISTASLIPNKAINYKFIKKSIYTNAELRQIRLSCQTSCPNKSCNHTEIITIQEREVHNNYKYVSISWQRKLPSILSVKISCRPTSILLELFLYVMSSVSTWTGLSIMSINPFFLFRSLAKAKLTPGISTLELRRHRKIIPMNHTDRISRLEDCVVSQSLVIEKLRQIACHPVHNGSRKVL